MDIAKLRAHLVERVGAILTGVKLDAADINGNGKIDIIDLAALRIIAVE